MHPLGLGCGGDPMVAVMRGAAARRVGSGLDLGLQVGFSVGGKAPEPDGHECRLLAESVSLSVFLTADVRPPGLAAGGDG